MQSRRICYRVFWWAELLDSKWCERDSAGFYVVCGRSPNVCHQFLVFGKDFAPEIRCGKLIWRVIGRSSTSLDGFFQACQKSLAGLASFHVFFQLRTERLIELFIQIVGKLRKHSLA